MRHERFVEIFELFFRAACRFIYKTFAVVDLVGARIQIRQEICQF